MILKYGLSIALLLPTLRTATISTTSSARTSSRAWSGRWWDRSPKLLT